MSRAFVIFSISMVVTLTVYAPAARAGDDGSGYEEMQQAERKIRRLRRQGVAAAPRIVALLHSDEGTLDQAAEGALVRWGAPAVPALLDALVRRRRPTRQPFPDYGIEERTLAELLCHAGRPTRDTYYDDEDETPDTPRARARARPGIEAALLPLMDALDNRRSPRARAAAEAIIDMAFQDTKCPNRPVVFAMSGDRIAALLGAQRPAPDDDFMRQLGALGPAAKAAVPTAMRILEDPKLEADAILLLGDIGPASAPAVAKLRARLAGRLSLEAATALGEIGAAARAALPEIVALLEKADRQECAEKQQLHSLPVPVGALGATGPQEAAIAVPALLASWQACPRNEEAIIAALGTVGPRGRAAEPALLAALRDGSRRLELRLAVAKSLHAIGAPLGANDQAIVAALEAEQRRRRTPRSFFIPGQAGN